jgi:hypothetical protein
MSFSSTVQCTCHTEYVLICVVCCIYTAVCPAVAHTASSGCLAAVRRALPVTRPWRGAHCRFDAPAFQRPWAKASSRPDPFCSILRCSAVTGDGRSVATTDSFSPSRHQSPVTSHYKIGNRKRFSFFTSAWIFSLRECEEYVLPLFRWNN